MSKEDEFEWSETYGTIPANYFDDFDKHFKLLGKIEKISVTFGSWINSITVQYAGEPHSIVETHGKKSGKEHTLNLDDDEFVTKVSGTSAGYINSLVFTTNKGRTTPVWGNTEGTPFATSFSTKRQLAAFAGSDGDAVNTLRLLFAKDIVLSVEILNAEIEIVEDTSKQYPMIMVAEVTVTNEGDKEIEASHSYSHTMVNEITITTGLSLTYGASLTIGWDFIVTAEISINMSVGFNFSDARTSSDSVTMSDTLDFTVAPKKQVTGKIFSKRKSTKATLKADALVTYASGLVKKEKITDGSISTFYQGYEKHIFMEPEQDAVITKPLTKLQPPSS